MAFEGVPLYVAGSKVEAVVLRVVPYAAFSGHEGIIGPNDWKVVAGDTPGAFVKMRSGAGSILARGPQQAYQMYAALMRTETQVPITATDSSGPRSDLVIVRVEDPGDGSGLWSAPANAEVGPYVFVRVIEGVPDTTERMSDIFPDIGVQSALACARVDLPASTATVTQDMITSLRWLGNPHTHFVQESKPNISDPSVDIATAYTTSYTPYPQTNGSYTIDVPPWATELSFKFDVITAIAYTANTGAANMWGNEDVLMDGAGVGAFTEWNFDWNGGAARYTMSCAQSHIDVTAKQGQQVTLQHRVKFQGGQGGNLQEDNGTYTFLQAYFTQGTL